MEMSKITEIITMYVVPYVITIIPTICIIAKSVHSFIKVRKEQIRINDLLEENKQIRQELITTNQKLDELMTVIDHVERK